MVWKTDCPIWGVGHKAAIHGEAIGAKGNKFIADEARVDSPRTDGFYKLNEDVYRFLLSRRLSSNDVKARLTTWLIDQRRQGVIIPVVTYEIAYSFIETEDRRSLPVAKRAERLLRFLVNRTRYTGETVLVDECYESALAWSESIDVNEVFFLLNYLSEQGFIYDYKHVIKGPERCLATVSVEGYGFLEELIVNPDSSQAFVAMWFADEMNNAYENGIRPAIKKAGYKPLRIDLKHDVKRLTTKSLPKLDVHAS